MRRKEPQKIKALSAELVRVHLEQAEKRAAHYRSRGGYTPKYIVLHYTGVANQSEAGAIQYFAKDSAASSAHFVVGPRGIYQTLPLVQAAWHVADGKPDAKYERAADAERYHESRAGASLRGNSNSVGVELVVRKTRSDKKSVTDTDWYFEPETVEHAAQLVAALAELLQIPTERIIRHMDATGKPCPRPFVSLKGDGGTEYEQAWAAFKRRVDELRLRVYVEGEIT